MGRGSTDGNGNLASLTAQIPSVSCGSTYTMTFMDNVTFQPVYLPFAVSCAPVVPAGRTPIAESASGAMARADAEAAFRDRRPHRAA